MKLNVIIVDDSAVQLTISSKLIERNKHLNLVGAFSDPYLALKAINKENIDLVLLDIEMPEIDGFELRKLFKRSVQVVMNSTRPSFEVEAYKNGASDFLSKPLSSLRLNLAVSRVLELRGIFAFEKANGTVAS